MLITFQSQQHVQKAACIHTRTAQPHTAAMEKAGSVSPFMEYGDQKVLEMAERKLSLSRHGSLTNENNSMHMRSNLSSNINHPTHASTNSPLYSSSPFTPQLPNQPRIHHHHSDASAANNRWK